MDWNTASARQRFSALLQAAHQEPQRVFSRDKLVAVVIDAQAFEEFKTWQGQHKPRSLGQAFRELWRICRQESYTLATPPRHNRAPPATSESLPGIAIRRAKIAK